MGSSAKRLQYITHGILLIGVLLVVWEISVRAGWVPSLALPMPSKVLVACFRLLESAEFHRNCLRTFIVWSAAFVSGLCLGLLFGFAAGANERVSLTLLPLLGFLRAIPPIALFPVALVAIGPGGMSVGIVAALGAALYVFPGTAEAARETATRFAELAKILGSNRMQFFRYFIAPGAAVHTLASSRIAATLAFAVCVAGEMIIGGRWGVGAAVLDLSERYRLEEAYAYILYMGFLGLLIDLGVAHVTRMKWIAGETKGARNDTA